MWDLSSQIRDGLCPPVLEGEVLTTGQPEKSSSILLDLHWAQQI